MTNNQEIKEVQQPRPKPLYELIETVLYTLGCPVVRYFRQGKSYYIVIDCADFIIHIQDGKATNLFDIPDCIKTVPDDELKPFNFPTRKQYIWASKEL